jgi:hypothetical protein
MYSFKRLLVALLGLLLLIGSVAAIAPFNSYGKQSTEATTASLSTKPAQTSNALFVQAEASPGYATRGNNLAARFLVVVTDPVTGEGVTNLTKNNFLIVNHFALPEQTCGFGDNITSFVNVGTGAYRIHAKNKGCNWVPGDYLAQIMVSASARNGQATVTLSIE